MLRSPKRRIDYFLLSGGLLALVAPSTAQAGIPECGDIRLENAGNCEIVGNLECNAGCEELGVFKKACATKLHTVCREECTLDPEPTCTDECTEICTSQCDAGINITCTHNCFGECVGSCEASCEGADDVEQCYASCEATCDGECDIKCRPLVNGSCYEHCIECCGGSCTAQANMDCQTTCQDEEFESCEYEFRADCDASCSGNGALFCDGEYVISGAELPVCAQALVERGVLELQGSVDIDIGSSSGSGKSSAGASCSVAPARRTGSGPETLFGTALAVGLFGRWCGARRRRRAAR